MIEKYRIELRRPLAAFRLICDHCGEECDEVFDTHDEAVDYKVDRDNGWASVKDKDNEWVELCPDCNKPEIIAKLRGIELDTAERTRQTPDLTGAEFEGF